MPVGAFVKRAQTLLAAQLVTAHAMAASTRELAMQPEEIPSESHEDCDPQRPVGTLPAGFQQAGMGGQAVAAAEDFGSLSTRATEPPQGYTSILSLPSWDWRCESCDKEYIEVCSYRRWVDPRPCKECGAHMETWRTRGSRWCPGCLQEKDSWCETSESDFHITSWFVFLCFDERAPAGSL